MAERNRPTLAAEQKIAQLLLGREELLPPVNVHALLAKFAHVERATVPLDVDGLVYRKAAGSKPYVILNTRSTNSKRERFTAAHELGHILLPWQTGTVACHTDESAPGGDGLYRALEAEANRFAGELLVPTEWAITRLDVLHGNLAQKIIHIARQADVSLMVAAFSVANTLEGALIYITKNGSTMLNLFGSTFGRWSRKDWSESLAEEYMRQGVCCSTASFGPYDLHCVEFPAKIGRRPKLPSVAILDSIVGQVAPSVNEQRSLIWAINGIIGSANDRTGSHSPEGIYTTLRYRFTDRPQLSKVVSHRLFDRFLVAKSYELAERKLRPTSSF